MSQNRALTEQQELFLTALAGEAKGNVRKAMDMAGYAPTYQPRVLIKVLRDEITEVAKDLIASHSIIAVQGLVDSITSPSAVHARNTIAAAKEILDRAGIIKKEVVEVTTNSGGVVLLPPKKTDTEEDDY